MKRSAVGLTEIADWHNLAAAFYAAARGKRGRDDVEAFRADLDRELSDLQTELTAGIWEPRPMRQFRIRDPKPRLIHAPCFRDRVAYFASIDHAVLLRLLERRFKNSSLLSLLARIVQAHNSSPGRGLPIGTLTSQHFANFYLGGLDRCLLEQCLVRGFVRYMDDAVWWTGERVSARAAYCVACDYLASALHLEVKQPVRIGRSADGLSFCGYRILPNRLLLSRRRKRRYANLRKNAERAWQQGEIDAPALQSAYGDALALTIHADAVAWRREQLRRQPLEGDLAAAVA